jgi:hypothetical protein
VLVNVVKGQFSMKRINPFQRHRLEEAPFQFIIIKSCSAVGIRELGSNRSEGSDSEQRRESWPRFSELVSILYKGSWNHRIAWGHWCSPPLSTRLGILEWSRGSQHDLRCPQSRGSSSQRCLGLHYQKKTIRLITEWGRRKYSWEQSLVTTKKKTRKRSQLTTGNCPTKTRTFIITRGVCFGFPFKCFFN